MPNRDIIELALAGPIDWEKFESLVAEVLQEDDFPRLRKLGGRGDLGADAIEEVFYSDESRIETIVQATSQRAQAEKFAKTVERLRETEVSFRQLVIVYRHPVSSPTRTAIQERALRLGISVDIRNHHYLTSRLGQPSSTLYARYFGDIREQVDVLLDRQDPLAALPDRLRHAMLASVGAYVLHPRARIARKTLFEKTVLAALVDAREASVTELVSSVRRLLPEEHIPVDRIASAIETLKLSGECQTAEGDRVKPTDATLAATGKTMALATQAYELLRDYVLENCERGKRADDATQGYIERNLRRAVLSLFQGYGPTDPSSEPLGIEEEREHDLLKIFAKDVSPEVAQTALAALAAYVEQPESWESLAPLVRTYSALAIRNLDPVGRRWQQTVMERTTIALDTDAVLYLLIEDLPEHDALIRAARRFHANGISLVVHEHVLEEAADHVSRANRTYRRFARSLPRMSPSMVDGNVWHAVVRGFYYALRVDQDITWRAYWDRYFNYEDPEGYLRFALERRLGVTIASLDRVREEWLDDLEKLSEALLKRKERVRWKAGFRDEDQMRRRTAADVRMAMHLADYDDCRKDKTRGYLASEDRAFVALEQHPRWRQRASILIQTHAVPELAEFACGLEISDHDVVRLLFDPASSAAASLMADDIRGLTSVGVDLQHVYVDRLEWDLRTGLREAVRDFDKSKGKGEKQRLKGAMQLLRGSRALGYQLDPGVQKVAEAYDATIEEAEAERRRRRTAEGAIRRLAEAATGGTKRGKRRVNRILRELGIELERLDPPAE